tara:strand:- start:118 stop:474 length:357 start_codon:yes stop_codon:yes gene_type:complete
MRKPSLLFFIAAGLFSVISAQAALARPDIYLSAFEYGASVDVCLEGAEQALIDAGFTENIEIDEIDEKLALIDGEMPSDAVTADILCDQSLGVTVLSVSGLDVDLTYDKYTELFDSEW